ncbi:MAG: DUF4128 domain-containing protein [Hyphomonas sp.]|jgi:hypothetical protein|nr:DUF4128 domain-containing protein [Hyphomonas sp.]
MASPEVYDALRSHLEANYLATPLFFENEQTFQPGGAFVLVEFTSTTYAQMSIGARTQAENRFDEMGSFFCHIMVPAGSGVREAFSSAYTLADLFRGLTLMDGMLEFEDVIVGYGESQDDGLYYRVSVNVGWRLINAREP